MGIQDRDYMRERGRKTAQWSADRRDRPFTPPKQSPSTLAIVLFWVSAAFLLYRGYEWLLARQARHGPLGRQVVVKEVQRHEVQPAPVAASQRPALPERESTNTRVRVEHYPPPSPARPPEQEERPETRTPQTGGTIYLCKAYNGGTFWAQSHCAQHQALIDSIVPVPAGLPFDQQVRLAEQRRQPITSTVVTTTVSGGQSAGVARAECKALDARVEQLDAMARQPQSAQMQDWIRGERQTARDRQFALHC